MHDFVLSTRRAARRVAAAIAVLGVVAGVGVGPASAQTTRTVYAPMTFNTEVRTLRTAACLQIVERTYPSTAWWESGPAPTNAADRAFKAVIAAIKLKDRAALLKLTDPVQARDQTRFDQQAGAFFQQFQSIQLVEVPRAYEFDGLVAFFGKFRAPTQTAFVPLVFAHQPDGSFGFLPSRSDKLTFTLVSDWFTPSDAPLSDAPAYCSDADVKRTTHRLALTGPAWQQSTLLLTGSPLDAQTPVTPAAAVARSTIDDMKGALRGPEMADIARYMTPEGGGRLRQWLAAAGPKDRDEYRNAFVQQRPFFVFDETSLLVVYTRTGDGDVQVLYFTYTPDHRLVWTNSSHITIADRVFKQGPLYAAANATKPFTELVVK